MNEPVVPALTVGYFAAGDGEAAGAGEAEGAGEAAAAGAADPDVAGAGGAAAVCGWAPGLIQQA
jgi:hypothetical protein